MFSRIDLQDKVRRTVKEPRDDDERKIEQLRKLLLTQFTVLNDAQNQITRQAFILGQNDMMDSVAAAFDDLDDEDTTELETSTTSMNNDISGEYDTAAPGSLDQPETHPLGLPSNWVNQDNPYRAVELDLRIKQAENCLLSLRDAIADKSFQYSHVIRVAPRKGVRTRSRAAIVKLNDTIAYHARVYGKCRQAMLRLHADAAILTKYPPLLREHLKSSTALLNPNEPGSTRIWLSWIWKAAASDTGTSSEALKECEHCIGRSHRCPLTTWR